jgi:hypothetical protein
VSHGCKVCGSAVRSADEGLVFRVGARSFALCTHHARMAQTVAAILGRAALAGLEARYPDAVEATRRTALLSENIGAALRRAYDEREVLGLEPVEVGQRRPMRVRTERASAARPRSRRQRREEIIDAEIIEEVKL